MSDSKQLPPWPEHEWTRTVLGTDLDLQADIDTLTAIITRLEDQFYAAIAPHAEHLNGLRGRLAILHEMAVGGG